MAGLVYTPPAVYKASLGSSSLTAFSVSCCPDDCPSNQDKAESQFNFYSHFSVSIHFWLFVLHLEFFV